MTDAIALWRFAMARIPAVLIVRRAMVRRWPNTKPSVNRTV